MSKDGVVSQQALDDAQQNTSPPPTRATKPSPRSPSTPPSSTRPQAQVAQAQASLKQLEEQLSYTTITSPMDGTILSRDVEIGDAVSSILVLGSTATLVMTIGDINQVYVQGKVDESDIGQRLPRPGRPHQGRILQRQNLPRQSHQDRPSRRRKRQRHYLRGSRLHRQPRRRAQSQHDRQR